MTAARGLGHARELTGLQRDDKAPIYAVMRADELLDADDLDGAAAWRQIIRAIEELQRKEPREGEAVN